MKKYLSSILIIVIFFLSLSALTKADDFKDFTELDLEELLNTEVFTASRTLQKLYESPNAISVITAEEIKQSDLVITDIVMPKKDGLETIMELRHDLADVKIIAISGGGAIETVNYLKMAKDFGAMCALTKPIEREKPLEAVQECLSYNVRRST